ncbi:MAG: phospholipase D-like domain-containing protein [Treponema sp.]|nr:phospholipase D-like domain-containing protein [Treponema sp.]
MLYQSLTIDILADELIAELSGKADNLVLMRMLKTELQSLSDIDAEKLCRLIKSLTSNQTAEKVEVVSTVPVSFMSKTRKTHPVMEELVNSATNSITLTGYSISEHFEESLKLIDNKSKQGVVVEIFVNNYASIRSILADIRHTNRNFLKIYEYAGKAGDKMASLHAKTIIVDDVKMLISSANLSYHGLEGNIEIGALITSKKKASQVLEIFADLKRQKIFELVKYL